MHNLLEPRNGWQMRSGHHANLADSGWESENGVETAISNLAAVNSKFARYHSPIKRFDLRVSSGALQAPDGRLTCSAEAAHLQRKAKGRQSQSSCNSLRDSLLL